MAGALVTTVVGSYPQPDWLIDRQRLGDRLPPRVRARELWRVTEPLLEAAQDDATRLAVQDMERAGVDVITDGEMRRESYSNRFATALDGVDLDEPGVALDRTGHENPVPRVVGPIRRREPVERSLAIAYADAVNAELRDLKAAGADVVQIDEPYLQARPEPAREYAVEAVDRALDGIEGDTVLHTCFGYAHIVHDRPSGYPFLRELNECAASHLSLEAAQPDPRGPPTGAGRRGARLRDEVPVARAGIPQAGGHGRGCEAGGGWLTGPSAGSLRPTPTGSRSEGVT